MADDEQILETLSNHLVRAKGSGHIISTLAKQGNDKLVQDFLMDNVNVQSSGPFAKQSQLYVACFWGLKEIVQKLLDQGINPNLQNENTLWTPLHAASFQEHGPVVMVLLEYGAQPELPDAENRTPADFASASDKIWPFFAALEVPRTSRAELIEKGILRPGSGMTLAREAGHGIDMAEYRSSSGRSREGDNNYYAAQSGDVLADEDDTSNFNSRNGPQPQFTAWK